MAEVFEFAALERPAFLVEDSASAEERALALQAEAQHLGHQEGLERGMAEARARLEQALEAVAAAERAMAEMHDRYVADVPTVTGPVRRRRIAPLTWRCPRCCREKACALRCCPRGRIPTISRAPAAASRSRK